MTPLVAAFLLAALDPCAPVPAAAGLDPAAAAAYDAVGDEELARGALDPAIAAYRAALAADPAAADAREALRRLCEARGADPLERGLRLMDAGDCRGAVEAFRAARAASPSPSAALLQGICHHELGEAAEARAALREAEAYPPHRDEARFYLGLVALAEGNRGAAVALLEAARGSAALEEPAAELARAARQGGRLALSLVAEAAWDSNVNLAPTGDPALVAEDDAVLGLRGAALLRPFGERGPYLRAAGLLHEPLELRAYAVRGLDCAAGWRWRGARGELLAEYALGARSFGGEPYLGYHRLLAGGSLRRGRASLGATAFVRLEDYATGWSAFDGTFAGGEVRGALLATQRLRLSLAYGVAREAASESTLSFVEHGPRADAQLSPSAGWRLGAQAALTLRVHDAFDPALGATRRDTLLDAGAYLEADLRGGWAVRLSIDARRVESSVAALEYGKLVPALALLWAGGAF